MPRGASAAVHAAIRAKMAEAVGPRISRTVMLLPEALRSIGGQILDQTMDDVATTVQGLIKFNDPVYIPYAGKPAIGPLQRLRALIEPVTEEKRLIVVFVPINGPPDGYTSTFPEWLPWILVDPRSLDSSTTLLHEIGHACRLSHQQDNNASGNFTNVMFANATNQDQLWGWQVDTIFDSYWCAGARPKNWWLKKPLPEGHPFLWEEDP